MTARVRAALPSDLDRVAPYLSRQLRGGPPERYRRFFEYSWQPGERPNIGYLIEDGDRVVGFLGALYAKRPINGVDTLFCNISSWAVDDEHRKLSLLMITKLLQLKEATFTCFSPSDTVVEVLGFFKFKMLEREKVVFSPASGLPRLWAARGIRVTRVAAVAERLDPRRRRLFDDHRGYQLGQFLIERGTESCYLVTGRRGRGLKVFADVLHVDNLSLFMDALPLLAGPLLLAHRTVLVGIDRRYLDRMPPLSLVYGGLRPVQFRSPTLEPRDIDGLYTELAPIFG